MIFFPRFIHARFLNGCRLMEPITAISSAVTELFTVSRGSKNLLTRHFNDCVTLNRFKMTLVSGTRCKFRMYVVRGLARGHLGRHLLRQLLSEEETKEDRRRVGTHLMSVVVRRSSFPRPPQTIILRNRRHRQTTRYYCPEKGLPRRNFSPSKIQTPQSYSN